MTSSLRYVLRGLLRRRTRTVMGVLGIFLTASFLTTIQIGLDSVSLSYIDLVALQAGKADIKITAGEGNAFRPEPFDPGPVLEELGDHPLLAGLSPRLLGFVRVESAKSVRFAYLVGIDPDRERELGILGFAPEPKLGPDACAVSRSLAAALDASPDARLELSSLDGGAPAAFRIQSVIESQLTFQQEVRDYVVLDLAAARALLGEPERVHVLAGSFRDPRSYYDARDLHASVLALKDAGEEIAGDLGTEYSVELPKAAAISTFQEVSAPLRAIFGVFALLALVITGLLIYSLVSVGVEERIREFAVLRTVGAKRRYIFGLVLLESFVLCLMGVLPGVLCGTVLARGVLAVVELVLGATGAQIELAFSTTTLWLCLGTGAALSVGSSLVPAFAAVARPIVDALDPLRGGQPPRAARAEGEVNRPLLLAGSALSAVSVVVFFVLPTAFLSGNPSLIGAVVLGLLFSTLLGFTLVAVGILPFVESAVMAAAGWAFGRSRDLARRNLARHRRRNLTTSVMFTLSVSFVLFIASLVALFSRTSLAVLEQRNGADLRIHATDPAGLGLEAELARIEGVDSVSKSVFLKGRTERGVAFDVVASDVVGMKQLWIVPFGVDEALAGTIYAEHIEFLEGGQEALARIAEDPGTEPGDEAPPIVLSAAAAEFLDVHAGDLVELSFLLAARKVEQRFRVEAICGRFPAFPNFRTRVAAAVGSGALLSRKRFEALSEGVPKEAFQAIYLVRAGPQEAEVARTIRDEYGMRFGFGVESTAEKRKEAEVLFWTTQVFFGLLLGVAVAIAVFSLIASMATTVIERRWEIGVLKALGLSRGQLLRVFLGEATVLTLSAGFSGGMIGFALAYLFVLQAAALAEMPIVFTMPYVTFVATFAVSALSGIVAAWLPSRRILKKTAAEILRVAS
ncbi:MAG: ABC transporter permease [Planctomycetes bacterium]|nr:ABC transporter permease [Planctomycetota bacterium]